MKRTKKFLAMAIAAIMLMTMVPFTSAIAVDGVTEVQVGSLKRTATDSTRESYVSYVEKQAEGETFILRYTYNALTGNNNPNLTSGIILFNTANASGYMGLVTSNDSKHFLFSNGYQGAYNAGYSKEFPAVTNEPVSATAMFTRTATGTDIKLLMNGVEVTSASFNGYYIHTSQEGNGFWNRMRAAAGTSVDGKMYDLGTLTQAQKSELIAEYNASVSVADGVNDVTVSGSGVDGKILAGFKMSLRNNMTVEELKNKLVVPTGAALSVYADGSATEPLSGSATVSEGAVVKTISSNGYTKLEYPISVNDPMNMVWDTYKDTSPSVNTWKSFGRAQEDGETVAIHYTYNAEPCTLHASHPAGLMLSGGTWNTNNGVFMSNRTAHFLRESSGNANTGNAITTFPAKDGEPMDVVALVTRKGNGSETELVVNGTKLQFANGQGGLWSKITYADKYIGSGFTHMGIWENTKIYAKVESLGVLGDEVRTNTINGYCAKVTATSYDVIISGNSNYKLMVSDYKINYPSTYQTPKKLIAKLSLPTGASCKVYNSTAATSPLSSDDIIGEGAVLKVTSANGEVTSVYTLSDYSDNKIVTDATRIRQNYLQVDLNDTVKNGGFYLLQYDFIAEDGGLYFLTKGDTARQAPVYISAENEEIWFGSNTYTSPAYWNPATDAVKKVQIGKRYRVVCVLSVEENGGRMRTYVNGSLIRGNDGSGWSPKDGTKYFFSVMRVPKGTYAELTPIEGLSSVEDFDYSAYMVRVSSDDNNVEIAETDDALFEIKLNNKYTVAQLKEALVVPEGAQLTVMYGKQMLSDGATVLDGSTLVVQSRNKRQILEYTITSDEVAFTSNEYSIDYQNKRVSAIPAATAIEDFKKSIVLSEGFSLVGIRYGGKYVDETFSVADNMSMVLENQGFYTVYELDTVSDSAIITSEYFVSERDKVIYGVLKGTPVYKFAEKIILADGYFAEGIFKDNSEVTDEITSDVILKINDGENDILYSVVLMGEYTSVKNGNEYFVNDASSVAQNGSFIIQGSITPIQGRYELSFYDLYSDQKGEVIVFDEDGSLYLWNHRADFKWQSGITYDFEIVSSYDNAEADLYINGEKILNNVYASWISREKAPIYLKGNIQAFTLQKIYSDALNDEETNTYNNNFKITSDYFSIEDESITLSQKNYIVDELLSKIKPTNGSEASVCYSNGQLAQGSDEVEAGMYISLTRNGTEKQYYINRADEGIVAVNDIRLYKNEVTDDNLLRNKFSLPLILNDESIIKGELNAEDKLIVRACVSNYNTAAASIKFIAAGYDKNGRLVTASSAQEEIPPLTDGQSYIGTIDATQLANAQKVKIYLWNSGATPLQQAQTLVQSDTSSLESMHDENTENDAYRFDLDTVTVNGSKTAQIIVTSTLLSPNYKGLIFEEDGKDDIRLSININTALIPVGKSITDYKAEISITDSDDTVVKTTDVSSITEKMKVTFSSGDMELGDYTLRVSLIDKDTLEETDYNIWPLRKRSGDITQLNSYVDRSGRYIKNGKPIFYVGMYGDGFMNTDQVNLFKDKAIDGVQLYWQKPVFTGEEMTGLYSKEWYDAMYNTGMEFWPTLSCYYLYNSNGSLTYDNVFFKLSGEKDEGIVMEEAMHILKNNDAVGGYYIGDELNDKNSERVQWHGDIASQYDLEKPTMYMNVVGANYKTFNGSADIFGVDHYPVRFERDDPNLKIDTIVKQVKDSYENRPIWVALQCANRAVWYDSGVSEESKGEAASEKQLRNMVMQSVANGATGIWWFSYNSLLMETRGVDTTGKPLKNLNLMIRNTDEKDLLGRPLGVSALFKEWESIIMSDEETPSVELMGNGIDYITKAYNGKSYIFAVNTGLDEKNVTFKVNGATNVKNIYTGEICDVNQDGSFNAVFGNIDIAVFEICHDKLLSNDTELKNASFGTDDEDCIVTYDVNGDMTVYVPSDATEINYSIAISDKSRLFINGEQAQLNAATQADELIFTVIAEDLSESNYKVTFVKTE